MRVYDAAFGTPGDALFAELAPARAGGALAQRPLRNTPDVNVSESVLVPLVTANENLLTWAEANQRTGKNAAALTRLNQARGLAGLAAEPDTLAGQSLLAEILTEAYIDDFMSVEAWNLYKRTCTPNLTPVVNGAKIPARFPYDASERNTNTNIPLFSQQPVRNANDPANSKSDASGAACLGQ